MTSTLEATQQLVDTGSKEIADLKAHIADITSALDQAQAELADIAQSRQDRALRLQEGHIPVEQAEQALIHASNRAKWAQGTPNEAETVKDVSAAKKALSTVRKQYDQQRSKTEQTDQAATAREIELRKQMDAALIQLQEQQGKLAALQSTHKLTHNEFGELKHAALTHAYEEKQRRVEELRDALLSAQVAAHDFHEASLLELGEWPDQARTFQQLRPRNDATIRIIETSLLYIDTLLANSSEVPVSLPLPAFATPFTSTTDMWHKLIILENEVINNLRHQPKMLQDRRDTLQKLLDEYRAYMDTQEG